MKKYILALTLTSLIGSAVFAAPETMPEKTQAVERHLYGATQEGSIVSRVDKMYPLVMGVSSSKDLSEKVDELYTQVVKSETGMSLEEKIDALQWNYEHRITDDPIIKRLEDMEESVWGKVSTGALNAREEKLEIEIMGTSKALSMRQITMPAGTVFKISLNEPLNSKVNKAGDTFTFVVEEDVQIDNVLVVPKGTIGKGHVGAARKAKSFGRSGKLELLFDELKTADGTVFMVEQGPEAKEKMRSEVKAAGASMAGAAVLGPVGLVGGYFIKGKNIDFPEGTVFYVQPVSEVTSYGPVLGGTAVERIVTPTTAKAEVKEPEQEVEVVGEGVVAGKEVPVTEVHTDNPVTPKEDIIKESEETSSDDENVPNEPIIVIKRS